ncbi:MAG: FhaA domain-containing protein [Solirubrobacteraceae bacterium]|nr:MAG: DUF2662 domain-containing protein [Solirubrobacterales bacterium]
MSVLRSLESKIAGLVEGAFGRAFRSEVRPVEIARRLAREMEEHKSLSLSRTYVPNDYSVYLSARDHDRFAGYEEALSHELAGYLLEHARRERFSLLSRPQISFHVDERLRLGEFGIAARAVSPPSGGSPQVAEAAPPSPAVAAAESPSGHTMVYSSARRLRRSPATPAAPPLLTSARLIVEGRRMRVGPGGVVIGRSRECDIVLGDANVSRRHAEIRHDGSDWVVADLGSTNGVRVNGQRIEGAAPLSSGDVLVLGTDELRFELS